MRALLCLHGFKRRVGVIVRLHRVRWCGHDVGR